jgi:hypothetical protein
MESDSVKENVGKHFCTSCGKDISIIEDSVMFKCPSCGNDIARCGKCRIRSVEFVCGSCGFIGP